LCDNSNVATAGELDKFIARIREDYGDPDLKVDIVAHSMGGMITRYFVRYGTLDVLDDNEFPVNQSSGFARHAQSWVDRRSAYNDPRLQDWFRCGTSRSGRNVSEYVPGASARDNGVVRHDGRARRFSWSLTVPVPKQPAARAAQRG